MDMCGHPKLHLHYRWEKQRLRLTCPRGVEALGDGQFCIDGAAYRACAGPARCRLGPSPIEKEDLLEFLQRDLPAYQAAGLGVSCDLAVNAQPVVELSFTSVDEERVLIQRRWNAPPDHIDRHFHLDGYVLADGALRPGLTPDALDALLPFAGDVAALAGEAIGRFLLRHYAALKPYFVDGAAKFEKTHRQLPPPYRWLLTGYALDDQGVGRAYAQPFLSAGGQEYPAQDILPLMGRRYAKLPGGWVKGDDLAAPGYPRDGEWLKGWQHPVPLTPAQVVYQGDEQLAGPWTAMDMRGAPWLSAKNKQQIARTHLQFLTHWGLNGGLTGGFEAAVTYLDDALRQLFDRAPQAGVLVMGAKADVDEYARHSVHKARPIVRSPRCATRQVMLARYDKQSDLATARSVNWALMAILEPDALYPHRRSACLEWALPIKARCLIGFYAKGPLGWSEQAMQAQSQLLRLDPGLIPCLVQCTRYPRARPAPYAFACGNQGGKRAHPAGKLTPTDALPTGVLSGARFVRDAQRLAATKGSPGAPHVPFACFWPKHSDMNGAQRQWYFHLRDAMAKGAYPDTDLSYLMVRIYELINLVACDGPDDAYQKLMALWLNYRDRYPKLDGYLDSWTQDFIHVHRPGVSLWEHLAHAPQVPGMALDEALTKLDPGAPLLLSVPALEQLGGYRLTQSKFYQSGYQSLMNSLVPGAVAQVDSIIKQNEPEGILGRFKRAPVTRSQDAFKNAVLAVPVKYDITAIPYGANPGFKELLNKLMRYTENALRDQFDYGARLRGVALDELLAGWVDEYLSAQLANQIEVPRPPKVVLDQVALKQLRDDSDHVRETLIASMVKEAPAGGQLAQEALTDLVQVNRVLGLLTLTQRRLLEVLQQGGWEVDARTCAEQLPGATLDGIIDAINTHAMDLLGARLVAREQNLLVVADDFRAELAALDCQPQGQSATAWQVETGDLDLNWTAFFGACDRDVLGALLGGRAQLTRLAAQRGDMPELLIDQINMAAMDTIGDLIIDGDQIVPDYLTLIARHIRKV